MLNEVLYNLRSCWKTLVVSDLLFKAITLLVLTPIVSLLFRLFLFVSGRTVLADADIARFLLHPLGWLAFVFVGGALVSVLALEQAVLMTVCISAERQRRLPPARVLLFVATHAKQMLLLTSRIVAQLGLMAVPFLAGGGAIFWLMLTDHDINYYLTEKPPKFVVTVIAISCLLAIMGMKILRKLCDWVYAPQLLLYEQFSPAQALAESQKRVFGHRLQLAKLLSGWFILNTVASLILSLIVVQTGQQVVALSSGRLWTLIISVGLVILLATLANVVSTLLRNTSWASLLSLSYLQIAASENITLPDTSLPRESQGPWQLTLRHVLLGSIVGIMTAAIIGAVSIHSFDLEDRVQITAHRGGAGVAPENTLAAIRQAIADGTDWIEIDVQESKDGVVVVVHDSDLARVGNNPVKIWAATAEELRSVDIGSHFHPAFSDERVPTLEEVLQTCKGQTRLNIELKYYGHDQDLENRVIELVERFEMESEIVVMSLESKGIKKLKALRPDWTAGLLTAVAAGDLTRAQADFLAVNSKLATRTFIDAAHRRNKTVSAWTVNDAYAMSAMISRGIDNLITDHPAVARQVLAERQQLSPLERMMIEVALYLGARLPAPNLSQQQPTVQPPHQP